MIAQLSYRRYAILTALTFVAVCFWTALGRLSPFPTIVLPSRPHFQKATEVQDIFDFPAVNSGAIQNICAETQWNSSLIFTCDKSVGGVGNIRNSILNCVRYTISAGASLVVPSIVLRDTSDIARIRTGVTTELDYMFDVQHFLDSLRLSCPDLQVLSRSDIKDLEHMRNAVSLVPESLVKDVPRTGLPQPEAWSEQFYTWLEQYATPSITSPMIVDLERSYLQYPIYSDGADFAETFGSILKFRSDVRILATKTLQSLVTTYSLDVDLTQEFFPKAFFGTHLRTEHDAVEGWPAPDWIYSRYETQAQKYLDQAPRSNSSVIYVASGDLEEVAKFAYNASTTPNSYIVTTKSDLLKGDHLAELKELKWDQQGLVDFLVMLKASDFAGIGHSSFAWNVALKRHIHATERKHLDGPQMLSDELSQIYGDPRGYPEYAACLWP